ncbi:MAG: hypothetical protein IK147_04460 [Clostridia bacterium]|nr:hypothetical protein [Clostridia bacterium]
MKKYPLSFYVDICFTFFVSFTLVSAVLSGVLPKPFSIIVRLSLATGITTVVTVYLKKARLKKYEKSKEEEKRLAVAEKLNCSSVKENTDLFFKAFSNLGENPEKIAGGILLPAKKTAVFIRFSFFTPEKKDVFRFANKKDAENIVLFCEKFSDEVIAFAMRFKEKIVLKDLYDAFELLSSADVLPDTVISESFYKNKKPSFDIRRLFNKKKAKNYLFFGVTFTLFSFFAPIKLYYLIFGSVFLFFSLIVRLFGKEPSP